jgi:hypothetical protein
MGGTAMSVPNRNPALRRPSTPSASKPWTDPAGRSALRERFKASVVAQHTPSSETLRNASWSSFTDVLVESSWIVMAHGDAREGKWRGNWRMDWLASTLHTTPEHGVSSITAADAHTSAASSRLNWRPPADLNRLVRFAEGEICLLRVCHHVSNAVYSLSYYRKTVGPTLWNCS